MLRINKAQARKAFNLGRDVFIVPVKMMPTNDWGTTINRNQPLGIGRTRSFDEIVNAFIFYNCLSETGYYPAFYVKVGSAAGLKLMEAS